MEMFTVKNSISGEEILSVMAFESKDASPGWVNLRSGRFSASFNLDEATELFRQLGNALTFAGIPKQAKAA